MKNIYLRTLALVLLVLSSHFMSAQCTSSTTYQQATTCQGQPYTFYNQSLDTAGTYNDTIVLAGGCDSIISLQLFVIPILYANVYDTMCAGGTFVFGPYTLTAAGIYTDTFYYGSYFCDSVTILHLAIGSPHNDTFYNSATYCTPARGGGGGGRGYNFYGRYLTTSGIYTHVGGSLPGSTSCSDSVIILSLTVGAAPVTIGVPPGGGGGPFGGTPDTVRTCSSSYTFNGRTYTTDGNYADTIVSSIGCDSILTYFTLLLNSGYTSALVTGSSCAGAPFVWRGHSYAGPGVGGGGRPVSYYDTIVVAGGCDTIYTITVSFGFPNQPINVVDSFCAGSYYVYSGDTFTTSGYDTLSVPSTTGGCPTTVYLHLTYKAAPRFILVDSFCQGSSYIYRGHTYTTSGAHYFTEPAPVGCDSIIEVDLSYKTAPTTTIVDSFCRGTSYIYRGDTFTTAGLHSITYPSPSGCDTVVNITLSYTVPPSATIAATICQGTWYVYDGVDSFNTRGIHRFAVTTPGSCDSLIILNLTINPAPRATVRDSFCAGTTFYYGPDSFTTAGTYTVLLPAGGGGCDTIVTLFLANRPAAATPTITQAANVLVVNPLVANIQWYLNGSPIAGATSQTYIATQSGVYSVTESPAGVCSSTSANDTVVGVGINELSGDLFTIYPNPSNGKFTVETTQYNGTEIAIYDVLGRAVYQAPLLSSKQSIDMSGATNGTYYLVLRNQSFTRYAHFVIAQ